MVSINDEQVKWDVCFDICVDNFCAFLQTLLVMRTVGKHSTILVLFHKIVLFAHKIVLFYVQIPQYQASSCLNFALLSLRPITIDLK